MPSTDEDTKQHNEQFVEPGIEPSMLLLYYITTTVGRSVSDTLSLKRDGLAVGLNSDRLL